MNRLFIFLFLVLPLTALSDDFDDAVAAYANADYEKAYQLWRPLAEKGDGGAMFDLGVLYWDGKGIPRNRSLGVNWWRKAAEQNVAAAQYNLALTYYLGIEVDRNVEEAISLLRLAAVQGHDFAMDALPLVEQDFLRLSKIVEDKALHAYTGANIGETATKLYSGPSFEMNILETLDVGSPILVLKSEEDWSHVEVPDGIRLWVYGNYITTEGGTHKVTGTGVRVRTKPAIEKSSVIVGTLPADAVVEVTNVRNDWKQIRAPSSISAWIPNRHIRFTKAVDTQWEEEWQEMSARRATKSMTASAVASQAQTPETLPQSTVVLETSADTSLTEDTSKKLVAPEVIPNFRSAAVSANFAEVLGIPSGEGQLLKLLAKDTIVRILEERSQWARVEVPTGIYVWIYGEYLSEDGDRSFINTNHVRARSRPSTDPDSAVLGIFSKESDVVFISRQGNWKRVKAVESVSGWIRSDQLTILESKTEN